MDYEIIHQPEQHLFKTEVDGRTAFVQYRLLGDSLDIIHTIVPRPIEGRGIAAALVKAAYAYAIANGMKPKATCSYAVNWQERMAIEIDFSEKALECKNVSRYGFRLFSTHFYIHD